MLVMLMAVVASIQQPIAPRPAPFGSAVLAKDSVPVRRVSRDSFVVALPTGEALPRAVRLAVDTPRARPRAIVYSDWYDRRLTIHRWGSYTMLPLFGAEFALGQTLLSRGATAASWVRPSHRVAAYGVAALFTVNTVTGAWNLWDSRQDPAGRTRRWAHTALMVASDAGFAWTGVLGSRARGQPIATQQKHRNVALGSMAIATIGTALMWFTQP